MKFKRILGLLLVMSLIANFAVGCTDPDPPEDVVTDGGETAEDVESIIEAKDMQVFIEDKLLTLDVLKSDKEDVYFIPVQAIFEEMGMTFKYDESTQTLLAEREGLKVKLSADSNLTLVNSNLIEIATNTVFKDGQIFVPISFFNSIGEEAKSDEPSKTIKISNQQAQVSPSDTRTFYEVVKAYADAMIEHGTDKYGEVKGDILLSMLDRRTLAPLEKLPSPPQGVRDEDRVRRYGANLAQDIDLYNLLYILGDMVGDKKYKNTADNAAKYFLERTLSPETNLVGWGEHLFYNTQSDKVESMKSTFNHELLGGTNDFYSKLLELDKERAIKFALGIWEHQIYDQETGNFNRHGAWDSHSPEKDADFPRHAGYFMEIWAKAYKVSKDQTFLNAIEVMLSRYENKQDHNTGLIASSESSPNVSWPSQVVGLADSCVVASKYINDKKLKDRLTRFAASLDEAFLKLEHDFSDVEKGLIANCYNDTGKPFSSEEHTPYAGGWGNAYGNSTNSLYAMTLLTRYNHLEEGEIKGKYKKLIINVADFYKNSVAPLNKDLWADEYAAVITAELTAYKLTKDNAYLAKAEEYANEAVAIFWDNGNVLPRASLHTDHYEAITGPGTLAMALLDLYNTKK